MDEVPDRVYAVGDEVRLSVEIATTENPTYATATFCAEHDRNLTFTLHDDLQLEGKLEASPGRIANKTYRATLISIVDVDHQPGNYRLTYITYGDPAAANSRHSSEAGTTVFLDTPDTIGEGESFRIATVHEHRGSTTKAVLEDPPEGEL